MKRQAALQLQSLATTRLASSHSRSISRLPLYSGVGCVAAQAVKETQAAAAVVSCQSR